MDAQEFYKQVTAHANAVVECLKTDQLGNPTPCSDWDVRTLLNHMVYENVWIPPLLQGKTIAEVGNQFDGDLLGDDPVGAWHKSVEGVLAACAKLDNWDRTVHLSYGDDTAKSYVTDVACDLLIHSWDLGQGLEMSYDIHADLAGRAYSVLEPKTPEAGIPGSYAPRVSVADDAPIAIKLLAITGRKAEQA